MQKTAHAFQQARSVSFGDNSDVRTMPIPERYRISCAVCSEMPSKAEAIWLMRFWGVFMRLRTSASVGGKAQGIELRLGRIFVPHPRQNLPFVAHIHRLHAGCCQGDLSFASVSMVLEFLPIISTASLSVMGWRSSSFVERKDDDYGQDRAVQMSAMRAPVRYLHRNIQKTGRHLGICLRGARKVEGTVARVRIQYQTKRAFHSGIGWSTTSSLPGISTFVF